MIRVLIVDDSAVVRKVLSDELSKYRDIEVVGTAIDPYVARDKIVKLHPDVITLDVEMPRMDGLSFLAKLMKHYPTPVVIVSSLTPEGSASAVRALQLGAVEVISKSGSRYSVPDVGRQLVRAIRIAAGAHPAPPIIHDEESVKKTAPPLLSTAINNRVIAIGASTGGTQAIEKVLTGLPANSPGLVIVQHMPEHFTATFAERLNEVCEMEVREARDNTRIRQGLALVAPGNRHLIVQKDAGEYIVRVKDGAMVHHQRPSVDVLFYSVASNIGANAIGVLLTGMGADGAKGLLAIRENGGITIAQNEETCVVFGMPKEAVKLQAAMEVAPLQKIPQAILSRLTAAGNSHPAVSADSARGSAAQ
ncbi:MAG: chemotaxis response regulator protein-glutamate methylesterase [Acidobacteria bacterium]|nr:MAG: chemotaxis response regulator protein-glutamate methylesterase [Acidobacteriota bacterium]